MEGEKDIYGDIVSYGCSGECRESGMRSVVKVYDGDSWYITVRLSDIPGAEIMEREDEELCVLKRGIFIPFKDGGLTVTSRRNVLAVFKASLAQVASPKYTHLLTQIVDRDAMDERRRLGYKTGFVGHMRRSTGKSDKSK